MIASAERASGWGGGGCASTSDAGWLGWLVGIAGLGVGRRRRRR